MEKLGQNRKKLIRSLHKKSGREKEGLFIAEGEKLCYEIFRENFDLSMLVVEESCIDSFHGLIKKAESKNILILTSSKSNFRQISENKNPQGILAVSGIREKEISYNNDLIILDNISDPGNIGTIIRTADWFGFNDIVLYGNCADIWNHKTLRASMGSIFRSGFIKIETIGQIEDLKHEIVIGHMKGCDIHDYKNESYFAIALGNEAHGVSEEIRNIADKRVAIKGKGKAESLNVSIAGGILLYELSKIRN